MKIVSAALAAAVVWLSGCAHVDTREGTVTATEWRVNLVRTGSARVLETFKGTSQALAWAACIGKLNSLSPATYECQALRFRAVVEADPVPPPTCTSPQPPDETQTQACPAGTTGTWSQTRVYVAAPYPTCWTAGPWAPTSPPAGACATPPTPGGKPTADNTGPTTGNLTPMGGTTITKDGTVLENFSATDTISIKANNVTLRNFKIATSSTYGIRANYGGKNLLIEDGEVSGTDSAAVYGSNFTARRLHIHDTGADGFKAEYDVVVEDSFITKMGSKPEAHADGQQMVKGNNVIFRHNNFEMPYQDPDYKNSQVFILKTDFGPIDNCTIEDNWINGGGYSVQVRDSDEYPPPTNVRVINNRFGNDYEFGPWTVDGQVTLCGNVDADTGKMLSGNSACPAQERK